MADQATATKSPSQINAEVVAASARAIIRALAMQADNHSRQTGTWRREDFRGLIAEEGLTPEAIEERFRG